MAQLLGGSRVTGNLSVDTGLDVGNIYVANTTVSVSTTTGALVVAGGIGAAGNVFAGNAYASNFFYPNGVSILDAVWANLGSTSGSLTTLTANAAVQAGNIADLYANAAVQAGNIATLFSNAGIQAGQIAAAEANIVTANTAMKGYVDGQVSTLTSNAAVQAGNIADLYANAAVQAGNIATLFSNAGVQAGLIAAAEANIVTANSAMKGYVDGINSTLTANAAIQAGLIAAAEANIVTANTAMKGYVDSQVSTLTANAAAQAGDIAALYANAAVQAGNIASIQSDITALYSNAAVQAGNIASIQSDITTLYSNAAVQSGNISTLFSNAASQAGDITALYSNAAVQAGNIADLYTNAAVQAGNITALYSNAASQAGDITALYSNAASQAGDITALYSNAAVQAGNIADLYANAAVQAGNIATLFSNAALQAGNIAGLQSDITTLYSNAAVQAGNIATLFSNAAVQAGQIAAAEANIATANTAMKGYVDSINSTLTSNAAAQAGDIATLYANAAVQAGNIAALFSNAAAQAGNISELYTSKANLAGATFTGNISVPGILTNNYYYANGTPFIGGGGGGTTYSNTNVAAYLTTYDGTIGGNVTIGGNLYISGNLIAAGNVTTLNTDNLVINDPMIYLAEDNPSDILDIGLVASYTSGATYQHTGFVRDASDGVWKLFSNVIPEPTTTVDFTNAIYSDIKVGNLTVEGTGNIAGNLSVHAILTDFFFHSNGVPISSYSDFSVQNYLLAYDNDIITNLGDTYNLGSNVYPWKTLYVGSSGIFINDQSLTISDGDLFINGNLFTSTYSNVDVAAYLPTHSGNIGADYVLANVIISNVLTTGGNANTGNITGVNYLSAVSGSFSQSVQTAILTLTAGGYITFADGTTQSSAYSNVQVASYLTTNQIGPYSNANVGAYLTTFSGNIGGNITVANSITANSIYTDNYYYANGTPFSSGSNPGGAANSFQYNNAGSLDGTATLRYFSSNGSIISNGNVYFGAGVGDSTGSLGSGGQILKSTGTEIQWADYIDPVAMSLVFSGGGDAAADTTWIDVGRTTYTTGNVLVGAASGATSYSNLTIYHTTSSVGYDSGALQVLGGVGIAGNLHIKSSNHIHLGEDLAGAYEFSNTPLQMSVDSNTFQQIVIHNINGGNRASSDFVATADNGNDGSRYIDMGINSSTYNDPVYSITGVNDGYLYVNGGALVLGTATAGESVIFHTSGTTSSNLRVVISDTGLTVNTTTPSTSTTSGALVVNGGLGVAGDIVGTTLFGTLGTASQTNITELGTITSGTWNASTLEVSYGGTGATTATGALTNLLPAGAVAGYVLTTGGTGSYYWATAGGGGGGGTVGQALTTTRQANTATEGQTVFTLIGRSYTPGTGQLRVYVDGTRLNPAQYTETSNVSYTLASAVTAGQTVFAEIDAFSTFNNYANLTYASNVGNISVFGLTVQTALASLETSKATLASPVFSEGITTPVVRATGVVYANAGTAASSTTTGALRVTGGVGVSGNLYAGNLTGTNLTGTIITAAQPSITSLGNLTALSASGTIQTTGIVYGNSGLSGTLLTASQTNITAVGNLTSLATSGTVSAIGQVRANSGIAATSTTTGALTVTGGIGATGNIHAANLTATFGVFGTLYTASQTNVTTLGNLTGLTINGTTNTGNILPTVSNAYSVGSSTSWYTSFWGAAVNAQYADLAEKYLADSHYEPGTVLMFGGEKEVTLAEVETTRVAGVVSTNPAYLMNHQLQGENTVDVALQGRVPCKISGIVRKGDMMTAAGNGVAHANPNPKLGSVIGKALEDHDGPEGIIEIVVGRL